jgi:hypothetical protein
MFVFYALKQAYVYMKSWQTRREQFGLEQVKDDMGKEKRKRERRNRNSERKHS